jgi:urease accessory protein
LLDRPLDLTRECSTPDSLEVRAGSASDSGLQRAVGTGRIVLGGSEKGTRVIDVIQRAPIRILFPRARGDAPEEAVIVNTAGGIAGRDRLEFSVTALANASIAVTSQAAEKVYRALNEHARIETKLTAHAGAKLAWLPQETIIFDRARLSRQTEVDLSSGAELLALEWFVLGRAARGEEVVGGQLIDSWRVRKNDRLIWADSFRATEETFPHLHRKALLSDCKAFATLIYFGPHVDARLEFLRDTAPFPECHCAATLMSGIIVVRFAAKMIFDLKRALRSLLQQLSGELRAGPFRVPKMWSC